MDYISHQSNTPIYGEKQPTGAGVGKCWICWKAYRASFSMKTMERSKGTLSHTSHGNKMHLAPNLNLLNVEHCLQTHYKYVIKIQRWLCFELLLMLFFLVCFSIFWITTVTRKIKWSHHDVTHWFTTSGWVSGSFWSQMVPYLDVLVIPEVSNDWSANAARFPTVTWPSCGQPAKPLDSCNF